MKAFLFASFWFSGSFCAIAAQPLIGLWDAKLTVDKDFAIPFALEFTGSDVHLSASFFNGDERVTSTGGVQNGSNVQLDFAHYASRLEATIENGILKGKYGSAQNGFRDFEAQPHSATVTSSTNNGPTIKGVWEIPNESPKGEKAWRLIVRENGLDISAAILRVDGDTGTLRGGWKKDRYVLSLFDGARASVLEIIPQSDATLKLSLRSPRGPAALFTAIRPDAARAKGLPEPTNPELHTRMKNPNEPFRFSFPDLEGKVISDTDAKFYNKVVIVNIGGSWCPNCHDEAPYLEALYKKYRQLGLEIVMLDFEDAEQLKKLTRLPAFIKKYSLDYTFLVAGERKELQAKVPQAENLNAWPTTFFLGRDGKVRAVHAGFAAPASGEFHNELMQSITRTVETLLAESGSLASGTD